MPLAQARDPRGHDTVGSPAPVAQRIEHRPPEPGAQVRVLPGAHSKIHKRGSTGRIAAEGVKLLATGATKIKPSPSKDLRTIVDHLLADWDRGSESVGSWFSSVLVASPDHVFMESGYGKGENT
jgi:hypothetical protein